MLRAATERFQRNLTAIDDAQRAEVEAQAEQTYALEELVLASAEAAAVIIGAEAVERSVAEIAGRFDEPAELEADLARNGLDIAALKQALRRELTFDAVMRRIGSRYSAVTETDARIFFELHHDRFQTPERRTARHILITVNDDYAENTADASASRAARLAAKLHAESGNTLQRFARLARRYSECPTAMEDGKLGDIQRGQLYPEVDAVLFALTEGEASEPVASEIGYHILLCERISPARTLPFNKAKERIVSALQERRSREAQRAWVAELRERARIAA
jgi:peptidyl-prolyl cis-trans isomerase C